MHRVWSNRGENEGAGDPTVGGRRFKATILTGIDSASGTAFQAAGPNSPQRDLTGRFVFLAL